MSRDQMITEHKKKLKMLKEQRSRISESIIRLQQKIDNMMMAREEKHAVLDFKKKPRSHSCLGAQCVY